MEVTMLITGIVLVSMIGYLAWFKKRKWHVIHENIGLSEELSNQYAFLKNEGIRCKLKYEPLTNASRGVGFVNNDESSAMEYEKVFLEVHKNDLDKANQLMEDLDQQTGFRL